MREREDEAERGILPSIASERRHGARLYEPLQGNPEGKAGPTTKQRGVERE